MVSGSVLVALQWDRVRERVMAEVVPMVEMATDESDRIPSHSSFGWRYAMLQAFLEHWPAHPVLGHGPGASPTLLRQNQVNLLQERTFNKFHNSYLDILAELGVVGLALFGVLAYLLVSRLHRAHRRGAIPGDLALFVVSALLLIALSALSNEAFDNRNGKFVIAILGGMAYAAALARRLGERGGVVPLLRPAPARPLRLVYLAAAAIPSPQARSLNIMRSCAALAELGHRVTLVAPPAPGGTDDDPFAYYGVAKAFDLVRLPAPDGPGGRTLFTAAAALLVLARQPDLVYGRYLRGCLWTCRLGFATAFELHSPIQGRRRLRELRRLVRCPHLAGLVTLTDGLRRYFRDQDIPGIRQVPFLVAGSGGDDPTPPPVPRPLARRGGGLALAYAGSLQGYKGMDLVRELADRLASHDIHVFGGTPEETSRWRETIPGGNVHFHGHLPFPELLAHLADADVCLLPNRRNPRNPAGEPFTSPLKLFDYMALGRPVVAADFPEVREVLNGSNGVLVDPEDPAAWAAAIDALDPDTRERLGGQARRDFLARHTRTARYRRVLGALLEGEGDTAGAPTP
jgi:glycosyltransferase involved in cell wall biosynthesis